MRKHIKNFENFRISKKRTDIIQESVLQVNDLYRVKTTVDIPQSLLNAYIKKVKDISGKNIRQFFGDMDLAEEIVKWVTQNGLDPEKIPANAIIGGETQNQSQAQSNSQNTSDHQNVTENKPQAQTQNKVQVQTQSQGQNHTQGQSHSQGQNHTQGQSHSQSQSNHDFEDVNDEDDDNLPS